ncbi:MAG: TorF family putative porin [Gammaproteobacteria bacterium]|nr:TorF family putative porin [Gammaproteobacteria bacterium]
MKAINMRKAVSGAVMVLAGVASLPVMADFTGNVGATSNYVWRGTTQTANQAAVSGGLDYAHEVGIYAGAWASNTVFGDKLADPADPTSVIPSQELDYYAGFSKEFGDFGVDAGAIKYAYPQADALDWVEVYLGFSFKNFSVKVNSSSDVFATDTDGMYVEAAADFEMPGGSTLGVHVGSYKFDAAPALDYKDYSISLSKDEFTFAVSDTDAEDVDWPYDADMKVTISWAKEFDLLK